MPNNNRGALRFIGTPYGIETRAEEGEKKEYIIKGYAALYETPSDAARWYTEIIKSGAFEEAVTISDIRALLNHDPNHILARMKPGRLNNTLNVISDDKGLYFEFVMPRSQEQLMEAILREDITQNSFAFTMEVGEERWIEEKIDDEWHVTREIIKVDKIYDVSLVTYPFYEETSFTYEEKSYKSWSEKNGKLAKSKSHEDAEFERKYRSDMIELLEKNVI